VRRRRARVSETWTEEIGAATLTTDKVDRFSLDVAGHRSVEVLTAGPEDGLPLLFHTGTPSGLVHYRPLVEAAAEHGLRSVLYSRPGYGKSDPQPGRRVADAAADVTAVADHLGVNEFVTAGWSGGGPHALACAALLSDRCAAAATIAGVAPNGAAGLDWFAGMAQENIEEFGVAVSGEAELTAYLTEASAALAQVTGAEIARALGGLVTAPDVAALEGGFADYMAEATTSAVATGIAGWRDDDLAFVGEWGFSLADIRIPVTVWQGDQDAMVPVGHGEWLAANISGARRRIVAGEGHLSLVAKRLSEILSELAAAA
jgi:pimeloyl-ACP methyl ester carboxylesterase